MKNTGKKIAALAAMAAGTAAAIHIFNTYIDKQADLGLLEEDETLTYNWRLSPVRYRKYGSGSPVLLLHELSACSSSYEWSKVAASMSADHTVYILDLPGCGLSEKSNVTYTNFFFVELITDFIKNVIQEPCDVIATGLSASLAITSCSFESSLFKKLLLVNPASPYQLSQIPGKRSRFRKSLLSVPILGTLLYHMLISRERLQEEFRQKLFYNASKISSEDVDAYYESGHKAHSSGRYLFSSITGNYVYFNITRSLQSINNDIVIIGGAAQEYIKETITAYKKINPAVESAVLDRTAHLPQLESPKRFMRLISVYLSEE
ncbi:MAG: alpha/beta fold hydrolase [Lachnospiraceae bacterium]|nr:alpha/beta fold hydrolase [Lachnospiraceae bacterium]